MSKELTLEDFEVRYKNIRESKPNVEKCSVKGCKNPRDSTRLMGEDTCCAYHRLLFDLWSSEYLSSIDMFTKPISQKARRAAFTRWRNKLGKAECDRIVLEMAAQPINWEC